VKVEEGTTDMIDEEVARVEAKSPASNAKSSVFDLRRHWRVSSLQSNPQRALKNTAPLPESTGAKSIIAI
jgi:hypothetical protein